VREDPPFSGPAAGIVAALDAWRTSGSLDPDLSLVLACDLPLVGAAVPRLMESSLLLPSDTDGICLADDGGRPQWLTGVYRMAALRTAASALPDRGRDASMRALLADLAIAVVRAPDGSADDIDTWEDLKRHTEGVDDDRAPAS